MSAYVCMHDDCYGHMILWFQSRSRVTAERQGSCYSACVCVSVPDIMSISLEVVFACHRVMRRGDTVCSS